MQIDFLGIQAFLAVAECGSFGLAAARLHLSQTAISHRMRKLEESLGVQLIVRTSRGITLTEAGDALLPRARSSVQELAASFDAVRRHGQSVSQWVAFGCLPTVAAGILEPLLQATRQAHPALQVRLFDSSPVEIAELVQARAAAFGVTLLRPMPDSLVVRTVAREPFVLVCPQGHPLAACKAVGWDALVAQPLIRISLASGNSMTIDDALGDLRERVQWRYEVQRTSVALQMVRAGLGLTVVPLLSVNAADGVAVVPIEAPEVTRMLAIVTRAGEELRPQELFIADAAAALIRARLPGAGQG
jgi:DNA-binding transcriptional LysR family regulator